MLCLEPLCPRKPVTGLRVCPESVVKQSKKQQAGYPLSVHSSVPCYSMPPSGSFVLGEVIYPLPNVFLEGECFLPVQLGDPYIRLSTLMPAPSFSPGAHTMAQPQRMSWTSIVLEFELHMLLAKTCNNTQFPSTPQSVVPGRCFSCVNLTHHSLFPSFYLPFSLSVERAPCHPWHQGFSPLQFMSTSLTPDMLSTSNVQIVPPILKLIS